MTTLALYEDLLRPGEVMALAAASRILFLAPGSSPATQAGPSVGCVLAGALRSEDEEGRGLSVLDAWSEGAHAGRTAASDLGATLVRVVLLPADSGPADGEQAIVLAEQRVRL